MAKVKRGKVVRYNKWGYIFLIPFVVVYVLFQCAEFKIFHVSFCPFFLHFYMLLVFDHNRLLFCALIFVFRNVFCHLLFHFTFSFLLILMTDFFPPSNDFFCRLFLF